MMTKKLHAVIIDDEDLGQKNLKILLEKTCPNVEISAIFGAALDALPFLQQNTIDILFLDISMPVVNGLDFLNSLSFHRTFEVIFVTAYDSYGIPALKTGAIDYLLKPIGIKDLQDAVQKVANKKNVLKNAVNITSLINRISIAHSKGISVYDFEEIVYLEGDNNFTTVFLTHNRKLIVAKTLGDFEKNLPENVFFRIHKSYIINLNCVETYSREDGGNVQLHYPAQLNISRRRLPNFIERMRDRTYRF